MVKYTKLEDIIGLRFYHFKNKSVIYNIQKYNNGNITVFWNNNNDRTGYSIQLALDCLNEGTWIPIEEQSKEITITLW